MEFREWTPDLVIAVGVIAACFALRFCGINGEVWAALMIAIGWVFGGQFQKQRLKAKEIDYKLQSQIIDRRKEE